MATQVNKARLCISQDIGPEVSVNDMIKHLEAIQATGRGHYKIQLDNDQHDEAQDVRSMQVFDDLQVVEFTHE